MEKMKGRPFALLGVNSGDTPAVVKRLTDDGTVTWRSWLDEGPIADAWKVEYYPTIYVLDHKGMIRYVNVFDTQLERAVDNLLKELEKDKSS